MEILDIAYQPINGLEVEDAGDEVLVYVPGGDDKTLYLNETASLVWRLCDGQRKGAEIVELLIEAYPESAVAIRAQVMDTLSDFIERGIVESRN